MNERDAQVGTNGGLSQRWRREAHVKDCYCQVCYGVLGCADELDAAKLRIEEEVKALWTYAILDSEGIGSWVECEAVLKIIREIL